MVGRFERAGQAPQEELGIVLCSSLGKTDPGFSHVNHSPSPWRAKPRVVSGPGVDVGCLEVSGPAIESMSGLSS